MEIVELKDIDIGSKQVFIRCDFNVPIDEFGNITDDRRIKSALSTIKYCLDNDCSIVLCSHLGRPKGEVNLKYSLKPVAKRLHHLLKQDIILSNDVIGDDAKNKAKNLKSGEILLLENIRFEKGETKNDKVLAKQLSDMADIFINDAFGVCHREHASVAGIADFFDKNSKAAGFLLTKEIEYFSHIVKEPKRPFVSIVGGSKISGKLQALYNLIPKVDKMIIGGGMAFTFLKALGFGIGKSLVEDDLIDEAKKIIDEAKKLKVKFYLPVDIVVAEEFNSEAYARRVTVQEIPKDWIGLDIGPATTMLFSEVLDDAHTILWNGPMGVYEMDKFSKGSFKLANVVANSYATTVIGGGDTADLIRRAGCEEDMTFISTGGGASLELLEGKILPGIKTILVNSD